MQTCKSPLKVMRVAHDVAREVLPEHASRFSRHDFTLAQLFACLALREMLQLSYRKLEATLRDTDWCQRLGMRTVPDHTTLCRAFAHVTRSRVMDALLDAIVTRLRDTGALGDTLAIDSTLYDTHRRSRHYERRCRQFATGAKRSANTMRSRSAKRTPKLGVGVDTRSHLICSMSARLGMGSDAPLFDDLLYDAWRRGRVKVALADAGSTARRTIASRGRTWACDR